MEAPGPRITSILSITATGLVKSNTVSSEGLEDVIETPQQTLPAQSEGANDAALPIEGGSDEEAGN